MADDEKNRQMGNERISVTPENLMIYGEVVPLVIDRFLRQCTKEDLLELWESVNVSSLERVVDSGSKSIASKI